MWKGKAVIWVSLALLACEVLALYLNMVRINGLTAENASNRTVVSKPLARVKLERIEKRLFKGWRKGHGAAKHR